jgi:ribosome biogenesis ATPase
VSQYFADCAELGIYLTIRILRVLCSKLRLSGDVDFRWLAKATPGYVGADLTALTTEAGVIAVKRIFEDIGEGRLLLEPEGIENMVIDDPPFSSLPVELRNTPIARFLISHPSPLTSDQLQTLSLSASDFTQALKIVQPSAKREGFATIPDVTWADIGALGQVRDELHMAIVQPIRHPELFSVVGIDAPSGVLLWGPPGCGKTLLAKAVASESRANFISVKGPELLNKVSTQFISPSENRRKRTKLIFSMLEKVRKRSGKCLYELERLRLVSSFSMSSMLLCLEGTIPW